MIQRWNQGDLEVKPSEAVPGSSPTAPRNPGTSPLVSPSNHLDSIYLYSTFKSPLFHQGGIEVIQRWNRSDLEVKPSGSAPGSSCSSSTQPVGQWLQLPTAPLSKALVGVLKAAVRRIQWNKAPLLSVLGTNLL